MLYKNISHVSKTFHGVTFKPGETKEVSKYINDPKFIRVKTVPKEPPESTENKSRRGRPPKTTDSVEPSKTIKDAKKEEKHDGTDNDK